MSDLRAPSRSDVGFVDADPPKPLLRTRPLRCAESPSRLHAPPSTTLDQAVLAAALDPILTIDVDGMIQSASESVQRVFAWSPRELAGRSISTLMPEPFHPAHDGQPGNGRRTGWNRILGRRQTLEGVRKDGARFPLEVSVSRVDPSAGGPPLFVLVMHDMEERTRLERELRLVKDLAVSIGSAPDLHHALVGTIRRICLATGWDYGEAWIPGPGEVEVAGTASWGRPDSRLKKFAQTMRCCQFHRGQGLPGRIWTNGRPIWVGDLAALGEAEFCRSQPAREAGLCAAAGVPIVSGDTPIAALIFFLRQTGREDPRLLEAIRVAVASLGTLIRRKQAEDELDQYRHRLESMVEERTRALRESQARLGFADRLASIGTLAAGLGHDMTNVLLPVRAHLSALRAAGIRGGLGAESRKSIETVSKSVWYLQELADGLHSLAVDPDEEDGDPQGTNLGSWWSQAGIVIAKAVPRHVRVRASFPNGLPKVRVAASGLTQAVLNLVINAGQAIPPDHEQGRVRVAARVGDGCVRVCVSDNGSGMTPQVRRRAFEMFFTTKPRGRGTGLGLALVQRVADHAGGSVRITSRLGKGTTVTMILPVAAPTAAS